MPPAMASHAQDIHLYFIPAFVSALWFSCSRNPPDAQFRGDFKQMEAK
jgi:hypothetical protein